MEWFGYDQGADVTSTVTFTPQAPTSDVVIGGTSPSSVFVGGDPAGGGTDLDGRQAYSLTFSGTPHPKQGYHVKLTVATPYSLGNDTKTKVFWVKPCTEAPTAPGSTTGGGPGTTGGGPTTTGGGGPATAAPGQGVSAGSSGSTGADSTTGAGAPSGVEASTATAPQQGAGSTDRSAAVPTAVDAGEDSVIPQWARSPWPLLAVAGGLALGAVGVMRRYYARG